MKGGFSFCGVDIADIGLEYAPENKDTYVYAPAEASMHEETFEGHDGGYSYGASKQPKMFVLRCYYEQTNIAKGLMAKALDLFKVGRKGMLIFKRRPWCYYYATVTSNPDISEMYSYLNGLIVITMKAYYPFARGLEVVNPRTKEAHLLYNLSDDPYHAEIMQNTALFDKAYMMPQTSFTNFNASDKVLLYNPGTERAKVDIIISGSSRDGVTITNRTTNQSCSYIGLDTENNDYIYTDGINGKTVLDSDGNRTLAFLYHDYGFIELEPAFPIIRDIYINNIYDYESVSAINTVNILYQDEEEKEWYTGKYIFLGSDNMGMWYKINLCLNNHTLILTAKTTLSGGYKTNIVSMNEIYVQLTPDTTLNRLSFIYKPTYS